MLGYVSNFAGSWGEGCIFYAYLYGRKPSGIYAERYVRRSAEGVHGKPDFPHTTTIGIRGYRVMRSALERWADTADTSYGTVKIKRIRCTAYAVCRSMRVSVKFAPGQGEGFQSL